MDELEKYEGLCSSCYAWNTNYDMEDRDLNEYLAEMKRADDANEVDEEKDET